MRTAVKLIALLLCAFVVAGLLFEPIAKALLHVPDPVLLPIPRRLTSDKTGHCTVPLKLISKFMQEAVLAAEDHRFYEHHGIDLLGLIRVTIDNIRAGHMVEGGSTITQQLAKIAFLDQNEKTARRKFSQLVLAEELESRYSKDRILEAYLNTIYFGRGATGIEDAAQAYFGIHASRLSIAQSAFLAGVIREPSVLGEKSHLTQATERQQNVIENMLQYGYITEAQAQDAQPQTAAAPHAPSPVIPQ